MHLVAACCALAPTVLTKLPGLQTEPAKPADKSHLIDIQNFATLIRKCSRWKIIYGANFLAEDGSSASPALAASEAACAAEQLGCVLKSY
jgi:hypothetical protein